MEDLLKKINIKKVGNISLIISAVVLIYYGLNTYKTYLEIKQIKKDAN